MLLLWFSAPSMISPKRESRVPLLGSDEIQKLVNYNFIIFGVFTVLSGSHKSYMFALGSVSSCM
jgi:hypothetical protein